MKKILCTVALLSLLASPAWAGDGVGVVRELTGTARITHLAADTPIQDMKQGDPVFQDDLIETQDGARAILRFNDDTILTVTGRGRVVIDEYVYDPAKAENNKSSIDILDAAFSYVGGLVDKSPKHDAKLNLNFGSIGIRGTTVYGAARNGLDWVYLEKGAVTVSNKGGATELSEGQGTRMSSSAEMPAPAYPWDEGQAAWIKNLVNDPAAHDTPAMAFNEDRRAKEVERQRPADNGPAAGGGAANGLMEEGAARAPAAASAPAVSGTAGPAAEPAPPAAVADEATPARAKTRAAPLAVLHSFDGEVSADKPGTVRVATVDGAKLASGGGLLVYSAELKTASQAVTAYIEVWLHVPDKGYSFARSPAAKLEPGAAAKTFTAEMAVPAGAAPDKVILNLVTDGGAKLAVSNLKLLK